MNFLESIRLAFEGVIVNKMRSFLTMLGIIIGVAAVIAVVAIGQGGKASILGEVEKSGKNLFQIMVDNGERGMEMTLDDKLSITPDDINALKRQAPAVKTVIQTYSSSGKASYNKKSKNVQLSGTTKDSLTSQNTELIKGKFFTDSDNLAKRSVAVIDENLANDLFKKNNPLGKRIRVEKDYYTVVGVSKVPTTSFDFIRMPSTVYIPAGKWLKLNSSFKGQPYMIVQAVSKEKMDAAISQTTKVLNNRHRTKDKYKAQTLEQIMSQINKITGVMTLIIGSIAGISLFVGGIGVMNIMLVSVTERTREIGIRKALGAQRKDILSQFLIEALVLCLIGGLIGTGIGIGGAFIISKFAKWPPLVNFSTVLLAVGFSLAIGVFFGLYPANKAAKMDPIEALRYE